MRKFLMLLTLFSAFVANAAEVHVYEETLAGGVATQISDRTLATGRTHTTQTAPKVSGYIFTHWTISTTQSFSSRDAWGRAFDIAPFKLYEDTTLSANYLPSSQDADSDGIADGYEMYWYGNLVQTANSDTDGDGKTFAEEIAAGTNPLMAEWSEAGPVAYADGVEWLYNPYGYASYTIRSEPEGDLFTTVEEYVKPGKKVTFTKPSGNFAYWEWRDGVIAPCQLRDAWGRAVDSISFTMPSNAVEIVAVSVDDYDTRMKLYWYGDTPIAMTSDTDGDGKTFAEELAAGTNPLMAERHEEGPVTYATGELWQYNPYNLHPYTLRSEPEGAIFATTSDYARAGSLLTFAKPSGNFAYWMRRDGDNSPYQLRDAWGRAVDSISMRMPTNAVEFIAVAEDDYDTRMKLYWYGDTSVAMDSDTDGDGKTFAEELAAGTNPLMAERHEEGPVVYADSELHEMNLQPYEQVRGTIVDDGYAELFTSPVAGNEGQSRTFDGAVSPTIVDLNGDGLFDLVVEADKGTITTFINKGTSGNPMFEEVQWNDKWAALLESAKATSLEGLSFDVQPSGVVSWSFADVDGDGDDDLLVADEDGRIWHYKLTDDGYILQNKVWGGSFAGFADGLSIYATDWDDDGDIDLVCGTAEGKLMLLNDPRVGRPVNVRAEAGVDSVVLSWDPNVNSRVRGYGIYRSSDSNEYVKIENMCPLPRYRDIPDVIQDYWYRITGKSRLYVTGNSTPIESESMPTDAVYVQFRPSVWLNDTSSFTETNVEVVVSMNNSMGISADGLSMTFTYDPAVLEPVEMRASGLTEDMTLSVGGGNGVWTMTATGGEVKTGSGVFMKLVFYVKGVHDVTKTEVSLTEATVKALDGRAVELELPKSATIEISDANPLVPAGVVINLADAHIETCSDFSVPITVTTTKTLKFLEVSVEYDSSIFEYKSCVGGSWANGRVTVNGTVPRMVLLTFHAKDQHMVTKSKMTLSGAAAKCTDDLAATVTTTDGTMYITDSNVSVPVSMSVATWHVKTMSGESFKLPVGATTSGGLAELSATIEWDDSLLTYVGAPSASTVTDLAANKKRFVFPCAGEYNLFNLDFKAADIQGLQANAVVRLISASGIGSNGLAANVTTVLPYEATVMIVREIGKYSPGDLDGDGRYTDADLLILNGYVVYLTMQKYGQAFADNYAKQYQAQYHVNVKLSGKAAKAADVNIDGKVNSSDISMLQMLIREAEGAGK